jgi:hypothetical protein
MTDLTVIDKGNHCEIHQGDAIAADYVASVRLATLFAAAPALLDAVRKAVAALEILDEDSDVAGWRNLDATYVDATIAGLLCHLEQCIAKAEGVTMEGTNSKERSLD